MKPGLEWWQQFLELVAMKIAAFTFKFTPTPSQAVPNFLMIRTPLDHPQRSRGMQTDFVGSGNATAATSFRRKPGWRIAEPPTLCHGTIGTPPAVRVR